MKAFVVIILIIVGWRLLAFLVKSMTNKKRAPQSIPTTQAAAEPEVASVEERVSATTKQAGLFMDASLMLVDLDTLNQEVPKVGACMYLVGAVDALSQHYKMGEDAFFSAAFGALRGFGLSKDSAQEFCSHLPEMSQEPFGSAAMTEGGKTILQWMSGKDEVAPVRLSELVREWSNLSLDKI